MPLTYFFNSLPLLYPEIAISVLIAVIVLADLITSKVEKVLPYISLIGLAVAFYFVLDNYNANAMAFLNDTGKGMVAVDSFGSFFKMIILISSFLVILFSIISKELHDSMDRIGEYYTLIFGMILGMFFMVSATNLILLYLSIELVSLSSYVLAGFIKTSTRSAEASLKYLIYGASSTGIMLFGISIMYGLTGSTNLYEINYLLQVTAGNKFLLNLSLILIFAGIGYKISSVPFHFWTPDVYEGAPTTITAYLSVASKAAGFALLIRLIKTGFFLETSTLGTWVILPSFYWQDFLVLLAILTMTLGNFAALWQSNIKRMLAYSSIAHAGYLLAALAVLSDQGLIAILIYFAIYMVMNLGAFLVVIIIRNKINSEELSDYDGLGYSMPLMGVSLGVFLISLTGLPPTAGFIGKLYIFLALLDAKMIVLSVIMVLNSVVSLYYYVRVLKHMFLNKPKEEVAQVKFPLAENIYASVLAVAVIFFGIYFSPVINWAKNSLSLFGF
ncbi:MAG: NADH-quinone oxidoreductase subunit N [Ignavibacteriaceae bacterium]|nr:NADH-quinone oxidoreductase subunit N [Ignavibacteriaceae bacterium]